MFEWDPDALSFGVTAVENRFLTDYLPAARGDFVKVYLWGLFACAHKDGDYAPETMARDLMMTVSEIEAALRYWERRGLVSRISEQPPQYRFFSPMQRQQSGGAFFQADSEYVAFSEAVYAVFGDDRKIRAAEISFLWEWVQDIGLQAEVVLMLLNHCKSQRGTHFSFKKAEPLAVRMKEEQVNTPEDAEIFLRHNQAVYDGCRRVLARMGKRRFPSDDELTLYEKWIDQWGFEAQAVLDACKATTGGDPSFKYLDSILSSLHARGDSHSSKQVQQLLEEDESEKKKAREVMTLLGVTLEAPAAMRLYRELAAVQPHEVILLAADECSRTKRRAKAEDMQALLTAWKEKGLTSEDSVRAYLEKFRETNLAVKAVFDACGHEGRPTAADRQLYEKWSGMMSRELILFAAEQARNAESSKMAYLDKVIEAWHEAGITELSQAKSQKKPENRKGGKIVSAQQYGQRPYTEEELLSVSDDLFEEARKRRG